METTQSVLLSPETPKEILEFLDPHIFQFGEAKILFARSFVFEGYFVQMDVYRNADKGEIKQEMRKIRLPAQYLIATSDAADPDMEKFGFVS